MDICTIGIIGIGKIAIDQHIPAITADPAFHLGAVANLDPVNIHGVTRAFSDYRALLALEDVEAVAICTPPQMRYAIARDAIEAGKHVLVEKPPAATPSELMDLASRAEAAGVTLFTAWHSQYNRAVDMAAEYLKTRSIRRLQVTWKEDVRQWHPGQGWIWRAGGFGVFDPGINALSILTHILPARLFITQAELQFPANCDAPIAAELTFTSAHGDADEDLRAVFDFRQTGPQTWDIEIETCDGRSLILSSGGTRLSIDGQSVIDEQAREYRALYARFTGLIRSGRSLVDDAPFRLVADAFLIGRRTTVEPFYDESP